MASIRQKNIQQDQARNIERKKHILFGIESLRKELQVNPQNTEIQAQIEVLQTELKKYE